MSQEQKRKRGRPSKASAEIKAEICARLSVGEPLAQICRDEHMPETRTVQDWKAQDEEFSAAYARARDDGFDAIAAGCLEIADDARNDWMERLDDEGQGVGWKLNGDHVQRSKLRIETRLKLLSKWDPKRYGDKMAVEHGVDSSLADHLKAALESD